jgi:lipopolysaccharide/colanic/teichoic acid biosynthesis glycosyltransferase
MKRIIDILVSGASAVLLSPLFLIIALAVKWSSHGPVFFRGERVGQFGRPFRIFKFRSMIVDADKKGPPNVSASDSRVTRVGRFLRHSKLDEIPQLISVFLGDMSLVGPRPEMRIYVDLYTEAEKRLLQLKPGITDWASIVHSQQYIDFAQGDDPDKIYLERIRPLKLRLQKHYLQNHSLWIDLKIWTWTFRKLILRDKRLPAEIKSIVDAWRAENLAHRINGENR